MVKMLLLLNPIINNSFQNIFQPKIYLAPEEIEEAKQELAPLLCGTINMAKALSKPTFAIFSPIINVAAWHLDKDPKHQAVHLKSFCPDCFKDSQENSVASLYKKFHPNFFIEKFKTFLSKF